ncbi:MAG: glycosyltransferase family 9 protein [Verrucomicrobiales bacterium]
MASSGKILVIRGGAIGDFVLTLPALKLIRESLPEAHLEVLGYRPMIDLALVAGYADSVRSIEYSAMAGFFAPGSKLDPELEAYFSSFSVVVSFLFDPDGYFCGNLDQAGVETIVRCPYKIDLGGDHAARQLAAPLGELAMFLDEAAAVIPCEPGGGDLIAWHPGSGSESKNWSAERWAEVFAELEVGEVVLITGEAEEDRLPEIEAALAAAGVATLAARNLGFEELIGRLSRCRLFFGHDSGISHLAAACGLPCVLLFGPTDPEIWAPLNEGVNVVRAPEGKLAELSVADVVGLVNDRGLL